MYRIIIIAALILMLSSSASAAIPLRGIVEGFYGAPYSYETRLDLLRFMKDKKLNTYIYAPKDDKFHREKWREMYSLKELYQLKKTNDLANELGIAFVFAVAPGLDISFDGLPGFYDRELLLMKLDFMHALGFTNFAVFFDDITEKDGEKQAQLLNWLDDKLQQKYTNIPHLITVSTEYFSRDMLNGDQSALTPYSQLFSKNLSQDILVLYTGGEVVVPGISDEELRFIDEKYGRELGIWWNYPVNDYLPNRLGLGAIVNLPKNGAPALLINTMLEPELSKIAVATAADYALDPQNYDADASFEKNIQDLYGENAADMKRFALLSRHMKNSWADAGAPDDEALAALINEFWASWPNGENADTNWQKLDDELGTLAGVTHRLKHNLPKNVLAECKPQLDKLTLLIRADRAALRELRRARSNHEVPPLLEKLYLRRNKMEKLNDAEIAEPLTNFFADSINYLEGQIKPTGEHEPSKNP